MRNIVILIFSIFVVSCATTKVSNYDPKITEQSIEINKLVHEYLVVTGSKANQDKMIDLMSDQMKKGFENSISKALARRSFKNSRDKSNAILILNKTIDSFLNRYKAELRELMPYSEIEKNIYTPILTEHFSAEELKAIISFYSSPIGKKYAELVPTIAEQSMAKINELYFFKISRLSETIADEEFEKMRNELNLLNIE